jgi:hypothetical protein
MAFLYPRYFPEWFGCVEETNSDPSEIIDIYQPYPTGMSLEKAMALVWKSKVFNVSGSSVGLSTCCDAGDPPALTYWNFYGQTETPFPEKKMSDQACANYSVFYALAKAKSYNCNGAFGQYDSDGYFQISYSNDKIYLYNDLYYVPILYTFGVGQNLYSPSYSPQAFCGNFILDGTSFPLYRVITPCDVPEMVTNITMTTAVEREAD